MEDERGRGSDEDAEDIETEVVDESLLSDEEREARENARLSAKRGHAIAEIVETEIMYYTKLKIVLDVFITPMREQRILDESEITVQFYLWETLLGLHKDFSDALVRDTNTCIADHFIRYSHMFKMYQPYLNNYQRAGLRRAELMTSNRRYADFLDKARRDPRLVTLHIGGISDLLVGPVQRIPRYELLLGALLKYTPPSHPEHGRLLAAQGMMREVLVSNNDAIGQSEETRRSQERLLDIMMSFTFTSRCNLLDDPSRTLIREGPLLRQTRRKAKVWGTLLPRCGVGAFFY